MPIQARRPLSARSLVVLTALAAGSALWAPQARADLPQNLGAYAEAHALAAGTGAFPVADTAPGTGACPPILRHTFTPLQGGEPETLCRYQGRVVLVVNTASHCGYTRQYAGLEALYRKYRNRGLVVIGFPSNDFNQEPGSNKEVAEFCRTTYGVQFPMYEKTTVARLDANPFYVDLAKRSGQPPRWNFHKYVIDRSGTRVTSFATSVEPDHKDLVALIERLLDAKPPAAAS